MTAQSDLSFDSGEPDHEHLRAFDADFTPVPVVRQFLETLRDRGLQPHRILDPAAGAGVFGMVARELWPNAFIEAIEPRKDECPWLACHYDLMHIATYAEVLRDDMLSCGPGMRIPKYDLIATNPPFSLWREFVLDSLPLIWTGNLALLGLTSWGSRSEDGYELFKEHRPSRQSRIPGTINFRGPGVNPKTGKKWSTDSRDYCWWQWAKLGDRPPVTTQQSRQTWPCENLTRLAGNERRWKMKPGMA